MADGAILTPNSLAGARIWLSGALPEPELSSEAERAAILTFVQQFAQQVFKRGGHVVHGSHPSFTPVLLEEARRHLQAGGRRDALTLVVSRLWSKDTSAVPVNDWRRVAVVYETPEVSGPNARDASLDLLRESMACSADAIVVVGGKWWQAVGGRAGVPYELQQAIDRGIPAFLLGGLGGAAKAYVEQHPETFRNLKNGLDESTNRSLATTADVGTLLGRILESLERLPLVRGRGTDGVSFRILALDGGGVKGAFTAAALAAWEKQTTLRVVDHFDLVAGTSTGGILALGLGLGLSAQAMLDFYKARGPVIFPVTSFRLKARHAIRHLFCPKYSQTLLLKELASALYADGPPTYLKDSLCRLILPAYHALAGASHQFRTPHHPDLTSDANTEAAHAAIATAAAPTYFSAAKIANMVSESSYFDGGVWANSPAIAAIVEAVCVLRIPMERIDVLSVGTTEEPFTVRTRARSGIISWLWKKKLLSLLLNVQQESSLKLAQDLVGEPRFLRVNAMTEPGSYSLDGVKEIGELADLGQHAALDTDILAQVKSRFLNGVFVTPWEKFG